MTYLLDVVIAQCTSIFKLLSREDQTLLVRWDTLLVLNLGFDIVDCVRGFHLEGDGFTRQGLDEAVVSFPSASFSTFVFLCGV